MADRDFLAELAEVGYSYVSMDLSKRTVSVTAWNRNDRATFRGQGDSLHAALANLIDSRASQRRIAASFEDLLG